MDKTRIIKSIKVNADKCDGCRACEMACSAFHAVPKNSSINPARSRVRIITRTWEDIYVPVFGGEYAPSECLGRIKYSIEGKEYNECELCRASCPSRNLFKEPDSGLPLSCDMCGNMIGLDEPMCVQSCKGGALTYEKREVVMGGETGEMSDSRKMEIGLKSLTEEFGLEKVVNALARIYKRA